MTKKIKAVAYARVSTDSKDQQNSYENQKDYFTKEIENSDKYELVGIYADRGISGTSLNRREDFKRMLYDAGLDEYQYKTESGYILNENRKPLFNYIFVKNTSRFARNVLVIDILRKLKQNKVYVYFLDIDLTTEDDNYEFLLNFFLNFDQQEAIDRSKKVIFGHEQSAKNGVIHVNRNLYGYNYDLETKELTIIPEEAEVIKKIFDLYTRDIDRMGIRQIVNYLEAKGVVTRRGKPFGKTTIGRILQNEKYYGTLVRNKYHTGVIFKNKFTYPKLRDKEEWEYHNNRIPAIISKETFEKAQEIRESRSTHARGIKRARSDFAEKIICGKCGSAYIRNSDNGRYFYNCNLKKTKGVKHCNSPNVQLKDLEETMQKLMDGAYYETFLYSRDKILNSLKDIKGELRLRLDVDSTEQVVQLKKEMEELNEQKSKLLDLFMEDIFDKEVLKERSDKVENEITLLQEKIDELSMSNNEIYNEIQEINEQIEKLHSLEINKKYSYMEILHSINHIKVDVTNFFNIRIYFEFNEIIDRLVEKYKIELQERNVSDSIIYIKELELHPNQKHVIEYSKTYQLRNKSVTPQ